MTLSVRSARSGLWWPLIFGVPSFIICSFPHCVADIFYYAACAPSLSASDWVALAGVYLATVVGNYLGCNIYRSFSPKRQHWSTRNTVVEIEGVHVARRCGFPPALLRPARLPSMPRPGYHTIGRRHFRRIFRIRRQWSFRWRPATAVGTHCKRKHHCHQGNEQYCHKRHIGQQTTAILQWRTHEGKSK